MTTTISDCHCKLARTALTVDWPDWRHVVCSDGEAVLVTLWRQRSYKWKPTPEDVIHDPVVRVRFVPSEADLASPRQFLYSLLEHVGVQPEDGP